ncbi:MAG: hypothetical protein KU29_04405 [Sulfurovum sp. FS06-10]|nr:MAG: hypothetical protein KU29_04405 [Sulfurovum sp. FS06-10]
MKELTTYKLKLTTLSPVHIGTGEDFEPTNYVIDAGTLYEFDEVIFYKSLSDLDKKALDTKLGSGWLEIIEFYKTKKEEGKKVAIYECPVSKEIQDKYNARNPNQLMINKTFKDPNTFRVIIPGSSIKGMLDTIFKIYPPESSNEERQKLIISDALMLEGKTEIGYSNRKHRYKDKDGKGIPQMVEVVSAHSTFIFTLKSPYHFNDIQALMQKYHQDRENSRYKQDEKSFIARIGKYSGKEYMVFNGKNVTNKDGNPLATHSLFSSDTLKNEQFGWVKIEIINDENYQKAFVEIENSVQSYHKLKNEKLSETLKKIEQNKKEREEKEREKIRLAEEEKSRKEKEEYEEKVRLASMSPFQILVESIIQEGKKQSMSEIASLVKALTVDNAFENDRCEAAHYIKVKMEAAKGEWLPDGNPAKDKATKRTHAVMKILEECKKM